MHTKKGLLKICLYCKKVSHRKIVINLFHYHFQPTKQRAKLFQKSNEDFFISVHTGKKQTERKLSYHFERYA
jgi:hypothetical protein